MKSTISAFLAGTIFGLGLIVSEMVNPRRVRGFLDITGNWDPTLVFVMGGALLVTAVGYRVVFAQGKPVFENAFTLPDRHEIDIRLILGAVFFGIGWGLSGLCPGPAIVGISTLNQDLAVFILAMVAGMKIYGFVDDRAGG